MSAISALAAVLLVAVQPPFPPKQALPDDMPADKPPAAPAAGGPGRRAVGTPSTVEQMRREQKSLLDQLEFVTKQRLLAGAFGEAVIIASTADAERRARVGLALAKSDPERAEELLVIVGSLLDLERYLLGGSAGMFCEETYFSARFQRLAWQVRLMESVGADPGVLRRLRDDQLATATAAAKRLVNGRDGGTLTDHQATV